MLKLQAHNLQSTVFWDVMVCTLGDEYFGSNAASIFKEKEVLQEKIVQDIRKGENSWGALDKEIGNCVRAHI
jgi:hypothetical protein